MIRPLKYAVFLAVMILAPYTSAAQTPVRLFDLIEPPTEAGISDRSSIASLREAGITLNLRSESEIDRQRLTIPLFDGADHSALVTEFERRGSNDFTWRGKIGTGDVVLTFKRGFVAGLIYAGNSVYEIIPRGQGHVLIELDQARFPECAGDVRGEPSPNDIRASQLVGVDSGDRVDVLVLYTTPVKVALGGDSQAAAFAQQAIDATNTAYLNSRIRLRVKLAAAQETAIAETGSLSSELSTLRSNAAAATSRNAVNADLVAMISNSNDACGIGYLMGGSGGNQNNAFTVTSRTCAVGNLSFAHELGHNMGSQHNPENGSNATYPFGFGHYVNGVFRTVMSYSNPCAAGCTRRPYFSNPGISFSGYPTGIDNARDNARSINTTADVITAYRYSGSSITLSSFNAGETLPRVVRRNVTWSSENVTGNVRIEVSRDAGTTWTVLSANTENDGIESISIMGPATRFGRLRVVSINNPWVSDSSVANLAIR